MSQINYTYTIEAFDTFNMTMRVLYKSAGRPDHVVNMPIDLTPGLSLDDSVAKQVESAAPLWFWEAHGAAISEEAAASMLSKQDVSASAAAPTDNRTDEQKALAKAAADRFAKEMGTVTWVEPVTSDVYVLDCSPASQARFSAATTAVNNSLRTDPSKWKVGKVTDSGVDIVFRDTTNAELIEWSGLVLDYVQKCFDAEAAVVAKIVAGDLTSDFETEFNAL